MRETVSWWWNILTTLECELTQRTGQHISFCVKLLHFCVLPPSGLTFAVNMFLVPLFDGPWFDSVSSGESSVQSSVVSAGVNKRSSQLSHDEQAQARGVKIAELDDWVKLTNEECCHNGLTYKEGNIVDTAVWHDDDGVCQPSGIYICRLQYLFKWLWYSCNIGHMVWIWQAHIPAGAKVKHFRTKTKVSSVTLGNRIKIEDYLRYLGPDLNLFPLSSFSHVMDATLQLVLVKIRPAVVGWFTEHRFIETALEAARHDPNTLSWNLLLDQEIPNMTICNALQNTKRPLFGFSLCDVVLIALRRSIPVAESRLIAAVECSPGMITKITNPPDAVFEAALLAHPEFMSKAYYMSDRVRLQRRMELLNVAMLETSTALFCQQVARDPAIVAYRTLTPKQQMHAVKANRDAYTHLTNVHDDVVKHIKKSM